MAPLAVGTHPNIVYLSAPPANGGAVPVTLIRYDVTTASRTEILKSGGDQAQMSPDGQWILFVSSVQDQAAITAVRVDGERRQVLYCTPANGQIGGLQWSPNQKWLAFSEAPASGPPTIYLLDIATGSVQTELLNSDPSVRYQPLFWLDSSRLYVMGLPTGPGPPQDVRLLDIRNGANQQSSRLPQIVKTPGDCWDADSDGTTLFTSQCSGFFSDEGGGVQSGPSKVSAQAATGGPEHSVFTSATLAVIQLRAIGQGRLLLNVGNHDPSQTAAPTNGLWKVNTDGSGLARLVQSSGLQGNFNVFSQTGWSNVSRDGSLYAFQLGSQRKPPSYSLLFGSLAGGPPTTFAASADGGQLLVIGWTTI